MTQAADRAASGGPAPTAAVRRRPGRPSLTNEELLDTALDLFLERGFDRTSIEAICTAAGMAKRTVYARYGDKTSLFKAALTRAIEEWMVPLDRLRAEETDDLEETLLRIGDILVANVLSPAGLRLLRLTNAESVRMPDISVYSVQSGTGPTLNYLADLLERRLDPPPTARFDAQSAAKAFLDLVVGGVANNAAWGLSVAPDDVDYHTRYSVHLFLRGITPEQGSDTAERENRRLRALLDDASDLLAQAQEKLRALD